jgi:hypothetical protein
MTTKRLQTYLAVLEHQGPRIGAFARLRANQLHKVIRQKNGLTSLSQAAAF